MSKFGIKKPAFNNYTVAKKSNPATQTSSWTNPHQQRNTEAAQKPENPVKPPTTEEWMKDNIFLKASIEPREEILRKQAIQTKLTVGESGDKYEQEADAMASKIMSMSDIAVQREPEKKQPQPLAASIAPLAKIAVISERDYKLLQSNAETVPKQTIQMKCNACEAKESGISNFEDLQHQECEKKTSQPIQQVAATGVDDSKTQLPHTNQIQETLKEKRLAQKSEQQNQKKPKPKQSVSKEDLKQQFNNLNGRIDLLKKRVESNSHIIFDQKSWKKLTNLLDNLSNKINHIKFPMGIKLPGIEQIRLQILSADTDTLPEQFTIGAFLVATLLTTLAGICSIIVNVILPIAIIFGLGALLLTIYFLIREIINTIENALKKQLEEKTVTPTTPPIPTLKRPVPRPSPSETPNNRTEPQIPVKPTNNKDDHCTSEKLQELKNCNSIKDKIVRRNIYPPETPYGQFRYKSSEHALGALINRIKNKRGNIFGDIKITRSDPSEMGKGLCPDGGGTHHQVRDEAKQYISSIICCECCNKDPITKKETKLEYCALMPKRIVPDAGELAPLGFLRNNNSISAFNKHKIDVGKQV